LNLRRLPLIGTIFSAVQFHQCRFRNCNFYKAEIINCYFDPKSVEFDRKYKWTASNIGVTFFQTLLSNSSNARQPFFEIEADIRFRQWKRAQLCYDYRQKRIGRIELVSSFVRSGLYEALCGFGYKPFRFAVWTVSIFFFLAFINVGLRGIEWVNFGGGSAKNLCIG
jgi:hypothetical protein